MADYLPKFTDPTAPIMLTLTGTVTGGQLVTVAGAVAGTASTAVLGVAGKDGVSGDKIPVWGPTTHYGTASGAINAGDPLCAGAAGTVRAWVAGTDAVASRIGRALTGAADTASVTYKLFGV